MLFYPRFVFPGGRQTHKHKGSASWSTSLCGACGCGSGSWIASPCPFPFGKKFLSPPGHSRSHILAQHICRINEFVYRVITGDKLEAVPSVLKTPWSLPTFGFVSCASQGELPESSSFWVWFSVTCPGWLLPTISACRGVAVLVVSSLSAAPAERKDSVGTWRGPELLFPALRS